MKCIKILILFCFLASSKTCFAETKTDTITNWQIYKGSELLFRSNQFDCYKPTGVIKKSMILKISELSFFAILNPLENKKYNSLMEKI
ncbi:hypothetical protein [Flavobacterium aquidurense]|uniref:hypothetical protein n=1 Tax=Flavobacterium aquidurense TaxID=362413 RepID=UPI00285E34F8|nr:hypothetical protein [Flavobacterium aquidurense]MDR7370056.1 hypothetical protein [Flavobacterium aquidurense]